MFNNIFDIKQCFSLIYKNKKIFLKVFKKTEGWERFFDYQNESHVAAKFGGHGPGGTLKTCQDELGRLLFGQDFCVTSEFRDKITGMCNGNQLVEEIF